MNILITGGAGYIGSQVIKQLGENTNYNLLTIDNLSTGFKDSILYGDFIEIDLSNKKKLNKIIKEFNPEVVIHLAGSISVEESIKKPRKYFRNNIINSYNLIDSMIKNKVNKIIFSSSAAVYGNCINKKEEDILDPKNPYGEQKLIVENYLKQLNKINKMNYIILRYFNVAGASEDLLIGQKKESNDLFTNCVKSIVDNKKIKIFGSNYPTIDGTCIRDFIHVEDIANVHIKSVDYLLENKSDIFNIGNGKGYSIKSIINEFNLNYKLDYEFCERRNGDIIKSFSNNEKMLNKLKFIPKHSLQSIIQSHYKWYKKYRNIK